MAKDKNYKDYLKALKGATESTKVTNAMKSVSSLPAKMTKTKNKNLFALGDTSSYLKRRNILSKPTSALARAGKRTAIGRIADTILKVGSGVSAGYLYAKKDEIGKKKDVKKAKDGMMITKGGDYIKDLID